MMHATYHWPLATATATKETAAASSTPLEHRETATLLKDITAGLFDSDDEGEEGATTATAAVVAGSNGKRALFSCEEDERLSGGGGDDDSSCVSDSSAATPGFGRRQRRRCRSAASAASVDDSGNYGELTSRRRQPPPSSSLPRRSSSVRSSGSCFDGAASSSPAAPVAEPTTPLPPRLRAALVDALPPTPTPATSPLSAAAAAASLHHSPSACPLTSPRRLKALGRDFWGDAAPPPPPGSALDVGLPAECCSVGVADAAGVTAATAAAATAPAASAGACPAAAATTPRSLPSLSLAGLSPEQVDAALGCCKPSSPSSETKMVVGGVLGLSLDTDSLVAEINAHLDAAARLAAAAACLC